MKVKHHIKKQKYLLTKTVKERSSHMIRRAKSYSLQVDPRRISPLDVDSLPFPVAWNKYFTYKRIVVEIGTGHGELLKFLSEDQDTLAVGFEITKTYTLKTKKELGDRQNTVVFKGDGYFYSLYLFEDQSIDILYILFPDPWHKKRHHKRRPLVAEWFREIHKKLAPGSMIYFATDWMEYYQFVEDQIDKLLNEGDYYDVEKGVYSPKVAGLVETHYYSKWVKEGRNFRFIELRKRPHSSM